MVLASVAAISAGVFAGGVSGIAVAVLLGGGVLGLFLGIALLAPRLVKPLARVVGWPASVPVASQASWRAPTPSAIRVARHRPPPR